MTHIARATLADIPAIRAMAEVVFPATYRDILSQEQIAYMMEWMYSAENLHKQMAEEGHIYYIAYQEGEPVGYLSIQQEGEDVFHLQKIYVLPHFQGMQWGARLFEHAIVSIKELHPEPCQMRLNVNRHNKALNFYLKMGMKKVAEGDFPIGNGYFMNDFIMGMDV